MNRSLHVVVLWLISSSALFAQNRPAGSNYEYSFTMAARRVETPALKLRLLPAEDELRVGNAAAILLRLPWDATNYFATEVPKFDDYVAIPLSDADRIREIGPGLGDHFFSEMRRAAYRRTADWEYPLREEPLGEIRLPDVQGFRQILARGLSVWVRFQIVNGKLDDAREGILVGLADMRHVARTPFMITQLASAAHANMMLDRLDELIQQPEAPNFYWALTALPVPFLNARTALDFERSMFTQSVEGLNDLERARTPAEWQELAERAYRFVDGTVEGADSRLTPEEIASTLQRVAQVARKDLPDLRPDLAPKMAPMSDGQLTVQWLVDRDKDLGDRIAACAALDVPSAIERLRAIQLEIAKFAEDNELPRFFMRPAPCRSFLATVRFDRRVAALRVIEAVRNYAAVHGGRLPKQLAEITETPVPNDPYTGKPFEYNGGRESFSLSAPAIEVGEDAIHGMVYEVLVKGK